MEHYPEIWYLGLDSRKIHGEEGAPQNGGYDDENGSYHKVSLVCKTPTYFSVCLPHSTAIRFHSFHLVDFYFFSSINGSSSRLCQDSAKIVQLFFTQKLIDIL